MKRVWLICQYASPAKYGFSSRHYHFAEQFARDGLDVSVITSDSNHFIHTPPEMHGLWKIEKDMGVTSLWLKTLSYKNPHGLKRVFNWFWFSFMLLFAPLMLKQRPEVLIVSSPSPVAVLGALILKFIFRCQLIFEIRDIWPLTFIDVGGISANHPFVRVLQVIEKMAYRFSDVIVSTLPNAHSHIRKYIPDFKFKCIPQGIDLSTYEKSKALTADPFSTHLKKENFNIGYAGALGPSNALDTIVSVAQKLEKTNPDIQFFFLGDGPSKPHLVALSRGLKNIHFLDKVKKEVVQKFLEKCDVVYDSTKRVPLYDFGISRNKWMDYMLSGKPLLVSYSGYLSLINDADSGLVVPSEDTEKLEQAILQMKSMSPESRSAMGKRGHEYVFKNRTFPVLSRQYEEIFK